MRSSNTSASSNDDVIPNFATGADQPVAKQLITLPNSIAELTSQLLNAISGGHPVMRLFPAWVSYAES